MRKYAMHYSAPGRFGAVCRLPPGGTRVYWGGVHSVPDLWRVTCVPCRRIAAALADGHCRECAFLHRYSDRPTLPALPAGCADCQFDPDLCPHGHALDYRALPGQTFCPACLGRDEN